MPAVVGVGSQLLLAAPPGSARVSQIESEPSLFGRSPGVLSPIATRSIGFLAKNNCPSSVRQYSDSDQNESTGGNSVAAKVSFQFLALSKPARPSGPRAPK